jgi:hypothetical protein
MKRKRARTKENLERLKVLQKAVRDQNPDIFFDWARRKTYGGN